MKKRVAIVGEIWRCVTAIVEKTGDGTYAEVSARESFSGATLVAEYFTPAESETLTIGVVHKADASEVKRRCKGLSFVMGSEQPTMLKRITYARSQNEAAHLTTITSGSRQRVSNEDALKIMSSIRQFRPDEIHLHQCDSLFCSHLLDSELKNKLVSAVTEETIRGFPLCSTSAPIPCKPQESPPP